MCEFLVIIGSFTLAIAFRSARVRCLRKLGALTIIGTTFLIFYFISDSIIVGFIGMSLWLLLPWIDLLTRVRDLRIPLQNKLQQSEMPNPELFPHAVEATDGMEQAGFEHVTDCSWNWTGMKQHFKFFWHPEERASSYLCLCEQNENAFAFLAVTSVDLSGKTWRTTNFPFSPTLKCRDCVNWHYLSSKKSCFTQLMTEHRKFLSRSGVSMEELTIPDPDNLEDLLEQEMSTQIQHNLKEGIVEEIDTQSFRYSIKGLFFLWRQLLKDMIRFC